MYPERRRASPPDTSDGVDFRTLLYGDPGGTPSALGGPSPSMRVTTGGDVAGADRTSTWGTEPPQMMWASTHYGDWLSASSPSYRPTFLPEDVQRVGEAQRVRGTTSYRGPSGISQSQKPNGEIPYTPAAVDTREAYLGAVTGESYIRSPSGAPLPDIYGRPTGHSTRGRDFGLGAPNDMDAEGGDVYVLAPDGDPSGVEGRLAILREPERNSRTVPLLGATAGKYRTVSGDVFLCDMSADRPRQSGIFQGLLGGRGNPSRRRSPWAAEGGDLGAPQAGDPESIEGPLESPPFERLSPLDVSKGPLRRRYPTDICCLFLFGGCWIVLGWLVLSSLSKSSPLRLTAGIDWMGRVCGLDKGVEQLPYLYWPSKVPPKGPVDMELDSCSLLPVCTGECPAGFVQVRPPGLCDSESETRGFCSWYSSRPARLMLRRFCVFADANGLPRDHGILHSWFHWVGDLALVWPLAFLVPLASFALAYGFFWVLRKAATSVIGIMVLSVELVLIGCSYHFFAAARRTAFTAQGTAGYWGPYDTSSGGPYGDFVVLPGWAAVGLGVTCAVCAVGFLLLVLAWWKQLSLCTTVLKSAAMVLHEAPPKFLALLPVFTATAFAVHTAFALLGVLHLMASGSVAPSSPQGVCGYADPWHRLSLGLWGRLSVAFVVLMALWTSAFISGVCQLVISYFTACCYFTPHDADRREILDAKAGESARVVLRNHLGSAALGGLLLSLFELVRLCLSWVRRVNVQRNETVFRWALRIVTNALAAVHGALSILTQTAFVYVALLGQPLFRAAWTAAGAQKRNPVAVAFVWQFGRLLQMVGQLAVAGLVTWGTYVILPRIPGTYGPEGQLSSLAAPLLFSFLVSYNVASSCMKCFGFASLTLLQCYLADVEMSRQEGKTAPEFAPRPLRLAQKHLLKGNIRRV